MSRLSESLAGTVLAPSHRRELRTPEPLSPASDVAAITSAAVTPLRIVYDASLLGGPAGMNRTGLFRTARAVAAGLAKRADCRVWLSAPESLDVLDRVMSYVPSDPQLASVPLLLPPLVNLRRRLFRRMAALQTQAIAGAELRTMVRSGDYVAALRHVKPRARLLRRGTRLASRLVGTSPLPRSWQAGIQPHVYHSPFGPLPDVGPGIARVLTVHDLIPILTPQYCSAAQTGYLRRILASLTPKDWVLTNSQATKDALCDYLPFDERRVFVTHFAADAAMFRAHPSPGEESFVRRRYRIPPGPYFLTLSTVEPRKNMVHVIRCFARFVQETRARHLSLVLAGPEGWMNEAVFDAAKSFPGLRSRIVFTGFVADEDLAALYAGSLAFLFASLEEGFGLPPLEAMQCGVPVVHSRLPSLAEVVGDAGIAVDPRDEDALCDALRRLSTDGMLRAELRARSRQRAAAFSWERCVAQTVAAYRTATS